jgi:hypothetical protein
MPFEKGNQHARKKREFEGTIRRLIAQEQPELLREVAKKVAELAVQGERWAVEMLRDTLDGRPATNIVATDDEGRPLSVGLLTFVDEAGHHDPAPVHPEGLPAPSIEGSGSRH